MILTSTCDGLVQERMNEITLDVNVEALRSDQGTLGDESKQEGCLHVIAFGVVPNPPSVVTPMSISLFVLLPHTIYVSARTEFNPPLKVVSTLNSASTMRIRLMMEVLELILREAVSLAYTCLMVWPKSYYVHAVVSERNKINSAG
jgi:hypothetical protein